MSRGAEVGTVEGGVARAPSPLPIKELDLSLVGRVRANISEEAVEDYAGHLERLPPVRVALVDERPVVVGGLHRVRAHERAGRADVPCTVEPMTWAEAVQAAVADNRAHGLRMSRADKRAAIGLLLAEAGDLSSRAVAELVGCSHHTVEEVRAEVGKLPTCPPQAGQPVRRDVPAPAIQTSARREPAGTRKGRDGKTYPPKSKSRPRATTSGGRQRPAAGEMAAALLTDFRARAAWVADYLRCVLRAEGGGHRAEALAAVLAALDADELRALVRLTRKAAHARGRGRSAAEPAPSPTH